MKDSDPQIMGLFNGFNCTKKWGWNAMIFWHAQSRLGGGQQKLQFDTFLLRDESGRIFCPFGKV